MAYYNFKMVRDRLPEWRVKEWEESGGSADCDSELWRQAAKYIDELKQDKERLDWLLKNCLIKELDLEWVHDSRETIDEAMKVEC